jgi:ABC-2 type transport system permease protein
MSSSLSHPGAHPEGIPRRPEGSPQPVHHLPSADPPVPDLRLCRQLRPELRPYAVLDQDHSAASTDLLSRLDGSGVFRRQADLARTRDISTWIDSSRALLVVRIDQDFERRLLAGEPAQVQVIADGRNSNTAGTALGYFGSVVDDFNADWRKTTASPAPPIRIVTRSWYNPNLDSRWSMIPSLIGTLTMMGTLMLTALVRRPGARAGNV